MHIKIYLVCFFILFLVHNRFKTHCEIKFCIFSIFSINCIWKWKLLIFQEDITLHLNSISKLNIWKYLWGAYPNEVWNSLEKQKLYIKRTTQKLQEFICYFIMFILLLLFYYFILLCYLSVMLFICYFYCYLVYLLVYLLSVLSCFYEYWW